MNKRARNRLIVGGVIIAIIAGAGFMLAMGDNQEIKGVEALLTEGDAAVGQRMKVTGLVVGESWDGKANPMRFAVRDDDSNADTTQLLKVEYKGVVPGGFGDKTKATLTGELDEDGVFVATDMLTVCPNKYQTKKVMTVDELLAGEAIVDVTMVLAGYPTGPVTGGLVTLASREDGGGEVDVTVSGTVPEGIGKGAYVEVTGEMLEDGTFRATKIVVKKKAS